MDNKKDNITSLSHTGNPKNQVVLKLFEKDSFFLFVYKKTERIVSALYLTSSLFSDNEPIKWRIREVGVNVIACVLSLTANPISKQEIVSRINADLLKLLSLLDIASSAGFVSEMNFSILKKELENILETLFLRPTPNETKGFSRVQFDKDFFALPRNLFFADNSQESFDTQSVSSEASDNGHARGTVLHDWDDVRRFESIYKRQNKGQEKDINSSAPVLSVDRKGQYQIKDHPRVQNINNHPMQNNRELSVIRLLKDKNNLTIRDFSLVIKGCSEKTIQRELLRLVKLGVLKKSGERRWSRYSLVVTS